MLVDEGEVTSDGDGVAQLERRELEVRREFYSALAEAAALASWARRCASGCPRTLRRRRAAPQRRGAEWQRRGATTVATSLLVESDNNHHHCLQVSTPELVSRQETYIETNDIDAHNKCQMLEPFSPPPLLYPIWGVSP